MRTGPAEIRNKGQALLSDFAVFAAAFAFLAAGAYPWLAPRDAGDLALSALTLAPAHPPGYPLYALAGHAWLSLLPFGSAAYRLNLLSAACAAGAAALLFSWARRRLDLISSALLAAAFVLAGPVRKFAGLQEMYATQALFLAALVAASETAPASGLGFLAGLGLVNHPSLVFALPGLALLRRWRVPDAARFAACAVLGLSLNVFLVVKLGWAEGWRAFTRAEYGTFQMFSGLAMPLTASSVAALLWHWLKSAAPAPIIALALYSLLPASLRPDAVTQDSKLLGRGGISLWLSAAGGAAFVVMSRFDVSNWVARSVLESAFVNSTLLLAAGAALGIAALPQRARVPAALIAALWSFAAGRLDGFHRDDFSAHDYVASLRRVVPPGASVVAAGDTALFGLRYAEAERPSEPPRRILSTFEDAKSAEYTLGRPEDGAAPEGLVQRRGKAKLGDRAWELATLRPSAALDGGESYAHDVRLAFAFAHFRSGDEEEHAKWAAALDPEDYSLEPAR